jgi:uncharacterized protein YdeI (BOF family)
MTKKMVLIVAAIVLIVSILAVGTAFAQTGTPPNAIETTIAEILANPVRDQMVTLTGKITQVYDGNEFTLDDSTGTILVDGGPPWFQKVDLSTGQAVTITGEVDPGNPGSDSTKTEIDLFSFASEGQTTTLRESIGRPPWAGGPNGKDKERLEQDDDKDENDAGEPYGKDKERLEQEDDKVGNDTDRSYGNGECTGNQVLDDDNDGDYDDCENAGD